MKSVALLGALAAVLVLGERVHASGMIGRRLVLPDVQPFPRFAVAEHRGDVLVAAPCADAESRDAVHLLDAETGAVELVIPNPRGIPCEVFGESIASDGAEIFVASPYTEVGDPPRSAGAVFVFSGTTGALERELPAPDSVPAGGRFGGAFLAAGPDLFVAAPDAGAPAGGRGMVFRIDAGTGAAIATYPNPRPAGPSEFGAALALVGDRLLVGDPDAFSFRGAVDVFDVATGEHLLALRSPEPDSRMVFGRSLAVASDRIAVGAPSGPGGFSSQDAAGIVYFFDASSLDLLGSVGAPERSRFGEASFGAVLGVFDGDFLVGAPHAPIGDTANGAAYLLSGPTGELLYRFHAPGVGWSVARVGGRVALGTEFADAESTVGYLFETCASLGDGAACDDGNGCDVGDVCHGIRCAPGVPVVCSDDAPRCHVSGCDPATGTCNQQIVRAGSPCFTAQDICSRPDVCDGFGGCVLDPDPDPDRDHVCSFDDTCPIIANPGQQDADEDSRGDVCDPSDGVLVIYDATVRGSPGSGPKGKLKVRGEFLSRADGSPFDPEAGLVVRVEDRSSGGVQVFVWDEDECSGAAPSRAGCRHAERPRSRIDFQPLAHQIDGLVVYRFVLVANDLEIPSLPGGPLSATITSQPPRFVSGFDRVGVVTGCSARRNRLHCRASGGSP